MSPANAHSADSFTILCLRCDREILARAEWIGRDVQCPHCAAAMRVPPRSADGRPVRAGSAPPPPLPGRRFSFCCPRCESLLESSEKQAGQTGNCPTCNARFVIPQLDRVSGAPRAARLLDGDPHDPTPMHAYAASGHQAPRIHRLADGSVLIECPRCHTHCAITANNCSHCGTPFTIDGVPTRADLAGDGIATAALVLGIISIPLCWLLLPGGLAVVLGLVSWLRRPGRKLSKPALAGLILGGLSTLLGLMIHLL